MEKSWLMKNVQKVMECVISHGILAPISRNLGPFFKVHVFQPFLQNMMMSQMQNMSRETVMENNEIGMEKSWGKTSLGTLMTHASDMHQRHSIPSLSHHRDRPLGDVAVYGRPSSERSTGLISSHLSV